MNKRTPERLADLCFLGILILMFAGMVFLSMDSNNFIFNTVTLCIVCFLFLLTYFFAGMQNGIILNLVFAFLFLAYSVFQSLQMGIPIGINCYFWIIWPFLMNLAIAGFTWQKRGMEQEIESLRDKLDKFVTIDETTQMNNLLAFERDANMYMNISRRYHMELILLLWSLDGHMKRHRDRQEDMSEIVSFISVVIRESLRGEDLVYVVDTQPFTWGILLFTNPQATELIQGRVEARLAKLDSEQGIGVVETKFALKRAAIIYDGTQLSPLAFLDAAKKCLQIPKQESASIQAWPDEKVENAVKREDDFDIDVTDADDWDI